MAEASGWLILSWITIASMLETNYHQSLLDKHAPQKKIQIVDRPLNDWINDDIQALKAIRRKKGGYLAKKSNCCQF